MKHRLHITPSVPECSWTLQADPCVPAKEWINTCATLLQTQPGENLLELGVCAQLGQLDVDTTTQAGTQVGGAGQDVAEMLVPHEAVVVLLEDLLNLVSEEEKMKLIICNRHQIMH